MFNPCSIYLSLSEAVHFSSPFFSQCNCTPDFCATPMKSSDNVAVHSTFIKHLIYAAYWRQNEALCKASSVL